MITTVTSARMPLFACESAAGCVVEEIRRSDSIGATETFAWVVMPDHLHWLFKLRHNALSTSVQAMKSLAARSVNAACDRCGAVWQPGFYDHRIRDESDLVSQSRYLVENPLRRGFVTRIEDYPYWWCRWVSRQSEL
jgi:putative transposase